MKSPLAALLANEAGTTAPPMVTYTPGRSKVCKAPIATPTLNIASEFLKVSGRKAPVKTTYLFGILLSTNRAVSIMVSVPWVTTIRSLLATRMTLTRDSRWRSVMSWLSFLHTVVTK